MEDILKSVAEAEERASAIRAEAENKAAEIVSKAEEQAAKIARESEDNIKILREERIRRSTEKANSDYARSIEGEKALQKKNADERISDLDREVFAVVRRITVGNR